MQYSYSSSIQPDIQHTFKYLPVDPDISPSEPKFTYPSDFLNPITVSQYLNEREKSGLARLDNNDNSKAHPITTVFWDIHHAPTTHDT